MLNRVQVSCPGSCGELFQGFIGETEYLVTLPITLFNTVTIELSQAHQFPSCPKIRQAFERTCDYFALSSSARPLVHVTVQQRLPISKGMSSSTADIVATIYGTSRLLEREISEEVVALICCQIEKTDSLLFSQLSVMASATGEVIYQGDWQPELQLLVLEAAATIDTESFHQKRSAVLARRQANEYLSIFEGFKEAVAEQSLEKLGHVATASSCLNQQLLAKPFFQELLALVEHCELLGLMVAHSGTVMGVLLEPDRQVPKELLTYLQGELISQAYPKYYLTQTTFGGPRFETQLNE